MATSLKSTLHIAHGAGWLGTAGAICAAAGKRVGAWFVRHLHGIQEQRMIQILSTMNETQLDRIGITRAQIPAYVAELVAQAEEDS